MELKELEKRLIELEIKAEVASKIADKALDMAMDAVIKLQAMKESTHKVELINPLTHAEEEFKKELEAAEAEDEVPPQIKVSPFTMFGRSTAPSRQEVSEASKLLENPLAEEEVDPFWDNEVA